MKTIKVDKVILYCMDRVDPDGNLYRLKIPTDVRLMNGKTIISSSRN